MENLSIYTNPIFYIFYIVLYTLLPFAKLFGYLRTKCKNYIFLNYTIPKYSTKTLQRIVDNISQRQYLKCDRINRPYKYKAIMLIRQRKFNGRTNTDTKTRVAK